MVTNLVQYTKSHSPKEIWRTISGAWLHGISVILLLGLMVSAVGMMAAVVWLVLNILPFMTVESWTLNRSLDAFKWTALVWLPLAYSFAIRELPSLLKEYEPSSE